MLQSALLKKIKFLFDENVDRRSEIFLKQQGMDIIRKSKQLSNGKLSEFSKSEGPKSGVLHVMRGGCFEIPLGNCRCSYRSAVDRSTDFRQVGFRCVKSEVKLNESIEPNLEYGTCARIQG